MISSFLENRGEQRRDGRGGDSWKDQEFGLNHGRVEWAEQHVHEKTRRPLVAVQNAPMFTGRHGNLSENVLLCV